MEASDGDYASAKDVYGEYLDTMRANYPESRVISKPQMGLIVSKIFKNVTVGLHSGHHIYKGLQINLNEDKNCDRTFITTVPAENVLLVFFFFFFFFFFSLLMKMTVQTMQYHQATA